jgi:tripeptide aminopeptidase
VTVRSLQSASSAERERLLDDFVRLCEIESPSQSERAVADAVKADLEQLGLQVEEDDTAKETGSDSGNLLARIEGPPDSRTILLCAHLDTVPLAGPVEVHQENGLLTNKHEAILGADNKAAVATILAAARRLTANGTPPVGVEILFTTCEEHALAGAKAFDLARLSSEFGYVFDHASPIGELITASPTYYRLEAEFRGQAAHAGIRPEEGHNAIAAAAKAIAAMQIGRLDDQTTANVGQIQGGTAANVVAERCHVVLETRSLDDARAGEVVSSMVDAATEAASDLECDVETSVERLFRGYKLPRTAPAVEVAATALRSRGLEPSYISTGGGSDANVFVAAGLPVVNVANGTERNHQPDESVTVDALEQMLDVTLAIVAASARI